MRLPLRFFQARFEFRNAPGNSGFTQLRPEAEIGSGLVIHSEGMVYYVACESVSAGQELSISPVLSKRKSVNLCSSGQVTNLVPYFADMNGASMNLTYFTVSHGAVELHIIKPLEAEKIIWFIAAHFVEIVPASTDIRLSLASATDVGILQQRIATTRIKKPLLPQDVLIIHCGEHACYVWAEKCQLYELM